MGINREINNRRVYEICRKVEETELEVIPDGNVLPLSVENDVRRSYALLKRSFDLILVLVLSPLIAMVFIVVTLVILIGDGRPVMYVGNRLGQHGNSFHIYKFRTMSPDADQRLQNLLRDQALEEEFSARHKLLKDPRITAIGSYLRRYSLDEIPQVINIIKGNMSWVGPRPITEIEARHYAALFTMAFSVKPGLTGMWQVSGRNMTEYHHRVLLDAWYAKQQRMALDIVILLRTISAVFKGTGV